MGIGNYAKGWDSADDFEDGEGYSSGGGGGGGGGGGMDELERMNRFRFMVPPPEGTQRNPNLVHGARKRPITKRVMFVTGVPLYMYEHSLYSYRGSWAIAKSQSLPCLKRNGVSDRCSLCADGDFPYYAGFFGVIDMGHVQYVSQNRMDDVLHHEFWTTKKGEVVHTPFRKSILVAKRGSQDKPGVLASIREKMVPALGPNRDLRFTVWDTQRTGSKAATVGDQWTFVEAFDSEQQARAYLRHFAEQSREVEIDVDGIDLSPVPLIGEHNGGIIGPGGAREGAMDIDPKAVEFIMDRITGAAPASAGKQPAAEGGGSPSASGAGYDDGNDDIPF